MNDRCMRRRSSGTWCWSARRPHRHLHDTDVDERPCVDEADADATMSVGEMPTVVTWGLTKKQRQALEALVHLRLASSLRNGVAALLLDTVLCWRSGIGEASAKARRDAEEVPTDKTCELAVADRYASQSAMMSRFGASTTCWTGKPSDMATVLAAWSS